MARLADMGIADAQCAPLRTVALSAEHERIWKHLREEDVMELAALGLDPRGSVRASIRGVKAGWAFTADGEPWAIMGVSEPPPGFGFPPRAGVVGLLGTPDIYKYRLYFFKETKRLLHELKQNYSFLENWVHARNALSLKWLARLGFAIRPPEPYGPRGELLCHIRIGGNPHPLRGSPL